MRKEKGITLVALIITIIIMLILVAVSVNVIVKSNLIGAAEKAANGYKTAQDREQNGGAIEINGKTYDSIEDYLSGVPEVHNWTRTGDKLTCKCKQCTESGAKPEGKELTIGQELDYKDSGKGSSSIGEEESGIAQAKADKQDWVTEIGTQTVHRDSETRWVVLGVEDSNGNNTNETLLLTTATPTTETIRMYGYKPYLYVEQEIDRMCKEIYGSEARGMTIEDVNACVEYKAPEGMCFDADTSKYYLLNSETTISALGLDYGDIWTDIKNNARVIDGTKKYFTPNCPEGSTDENVLGEITVDGYSYVADSTVGAPTGVPVLPDSTTAATKNLIFGTSNEYGYWLASRGVYANSRCANFGPGAVFVGDAGSYIDLFNSFGNSNGLELPLRAVVSLRSEIPAAK